MKNVLLITLFGLLVWTSIALIRVENERYALSLGLCPNALAVREYFTCIDKVETRTSPIWHLVYALEIM